MSDYQAIYDAVNLNFSGASFLWQHVQQEIYCVSHEMQRPSVLYRPSVVMDGSKWSALYGSNLMEGVSGFGDTPAEAMADFDKNWREQRTFVAQRLAKSTCLRHPESGQGYRNQPCTCPEPQS